MAAQDVYDAFLAPSTNAIQGYYPMSAWGTHKDGEANVFWRAVLEKPSMFLSQNY